MVCRCSHWFDDRIAAELRLWDAIDQHRLVAVRLLRHPRRARPARRSRGGAVAATTSTGCRTCSPANDAWARRSSCRVAARVDDLARDAGARLLRQRRACAVHGAGVPRGGHPGDGGLGGHAGRTSDVERARAILASGASTSSSPSTSSTKASTSPRSTRCCCCGRPTAPRLFPAAARTRSAPAHGKTVCTVLDFVGHHARSSGSIGGFARCWAAPARSWRGRSSRLPLPAGRLSHGAGPRSRRTSCWPEHPRRGARRDGREGARSSVWSRQATAASPCSVPGRDGPRPGGPLREQDLLGSLQEAASPSLEPGRRRSPLRRACRPASASRRLRSH